MSPDRAGSPLDPSRLAQQIVPMQTLTATKARAGFGRVVRGVLKSRKPVLVSTPAGVVQISPYNLDDEVPPAPRGSLKLTKAEIELSNTFGESL
jgi:hypothetical protein